MAQNKEPASNGKTQIILALITLAGIVVSAYFVYRGTTVPLEISLHATQTAEARFTAIAAVATSTAVSGTSSTSTTASVAVATAAATSEPIISLTPPPSPTLVAAPALAVVSLSPDVSDYDGVRTQTGELGTGKVEIRRIVENGETKTFYVFNYDLPVDASGNAGFTLFFSPAQDFSDYKLIEFTLKFDDADTLMKVYLRDTRGREYQQSVLVGDGQYGKPTTDVQGISIPVEGNYDAVNLNETVRIIFSVNTEFTRGKHTFTISDVQFR